MTKLEIISRLLNIRPGKTDKDLMVFKSHYLDRYTFYTTSVLNQYSLTEMTDFLYDKIVEKRIDEVLNED